MTWAVVVVAAGRGTRFGRPKQLLELAGLPMVGWSLRTFAQVPELVEIVVVTEAEWLAPMGELVARLLPGRSTLVVAGGATRQASVAAGLRALSAAPDALFVHDGARPLVRVEDVRAGMREVRPGRGAVIATPVVDTIKIVDAASMTVRQTLDRTTLWAAQTPQFAWRDDLERAHAQALQTQIEATDDVALLEAIGCEVAIVPATGENFKVTHAHDLARAELLLQGRVATEMQA